MTMLFSQNDGTWDQEPFYMEAVKDNPQVMAEKIKEIAEQADMIITTGGVSVGKKRYHA